MDFGNALKYYKTWSKPDVIISDGPYGIGGYDGDPKTSSALTSIYKPHILKWSEMAHSGTTLWFWNTEIGWARVHQILEDNGWIYRGTNVWDKGIGHIAGNCNGKTMRKFPVATEICVHYVRKEEFNKDGESLQDWLRNEWKKTGLTLKNANTACGVKNAASRKYLTSDHLWYFPPGDVFQKLVDYANKYGIKPPYFTEDGKPLTAAAWERKRGKFNFEYGVTNVWQSKNNAKLHPSSKPIELMNRIIKASSDIGDVIWEPFGGSATASIAAIRLNRKYFSAEINRKYYNIAVKRIKTELEEELKLGV